MNKTAIGIIIAIVVIGAGAFIIASNNKDTAKTNSNTTSTTTPAPETNTPSTTPSQSAEASSVTIQDLAFSPSSLTVKKGTTVTWTNQDSASHTVTGDNGGPASGTLAKGDTYSFKFDTAGTFAYHCTFHSNMTATVVVTE